MKKLQIIIIAFLISLSICAFASMQAKAQAATISLSPTSGHVGDSVTVSGSGFAASSDITATFDGSPVTLSVTTNTDSSGSFSGATFTVPTSTAGDQSVVVTDDISNSGSGVFTVYNQYMVAASCSTSDSTTPSAPVVLSGASLGSPSYTTLTTSIQQVWLDAGSSWSVNSTIVAGSGTEQWIATTGTSGTVSGAVEIAPLYYHQYQVTFALSGGGSTSPTGSNVWENVGSLSITATPNAGYTFSSWSSNTESITFNNANSTSSTATISGTGTITASFAINMPTPTPTATPAPTPTSTLTTTPTLTATPTPAVTLAPTSSQTPALAALGQYLPVIAAAIILGAVIIGLVVHRRRPAKIIILS